MCWLDERKECMGEAEEQFPQQDEEQFPQQDGSREVLSDVVPEPPCSLYAHCHHAAHFCSADTSLFGNCYLHRHHAYHSGARACFKTCTRTSQGNTCPRLNLQWRKMLHVTS